MPILKRNKKRYPKNWKEIRESILQRANNKCEFCGVKNYVYGFRQNGFFIEADPKVSDQKLIRIILTIAHLNHKPEDNRPENLKALCQRCHNRYDIKHRIETRKETKRIKEGQGVLFNES